MARRRPPTESSSISVEVANVGDRAADEVVQLYVRDVLASVTRPVKELRGFARVHLAAGQRRTVAFTLAAEQLAFTGIDGSLIVEPGWHRVMVGTSSVDLPCSGAFEVVGETRRAVRAHALPHGGRSDPAVRTEASRARCGR